MNYLVGPWLFSPAHYRISLNNTKRELDPLSFKLLSYFVAHANQIISREELVEQVWQQSFVDDNAINRAISGLRKLLRHDDFNEQLIKTHHRKGYSLAVEVIEQPIEESLVQAESFVQVETTTHPEEVEEEQNLVTSKEEVMPGVELSSKHSTSTGDKPLKPEAYDTRAEVLKKTIDNPQAKSTRPLLYLAFGVIVVLSIVIIWLLNEDVKSKHETGYQKAPLADVLTEVTISAATWNLGAESTPVTSSDGLLFAYSNIRDNRFSSIVKRLSDQREVTLKYHDFNIGVMSWQVNSQKLLVQLTSLNLNECHYATFDLSSYPNLSDIQKVMPCDARIYGYAQLDESGTYLYYTKHDSGNTGNALYRYHIASGNSSLLVPPTKPGNGILQAKLSRDGKQLAYVLAENGQGLKLYVYHLSTSENKLLFQADKTQISFAFDWSRDGKSLLLADSNVIQQINVETTAVSSIVLPDDVMPLYLSVESDNQVLVSQRDTQTFKLMKLVDPFASDELKAEMIIESESASYFAARSYKNSDKMYFVSNRTGNPQLWIKNGDTFNQLTFFSGKSRARIGELKLSVNEDYLLFKHGSQLKFLELANNNVHSINELNDTKVGSYVWAKDGLSIYYTQVKGETRQVWRFNLRTRQSTYQDIVGRGLLSDEHGNVYYFTDQYLHNIDSSMKYSLSGSQVNRFFNEVSGRYLYSTDGINSLSRLNLETGEFDEKEIPYRIRAIAVDGHKSILITNSIWKNTHIKRVAW